MNVVIQRMDKTINTPKLQLRGIFRIAVQKPQAGLLRAIMKAR